MVGKIAFLYAGQGSQRTGMGEDLYNEYPEFKQVFDSTKLDFDLKDACFNNPNNMLTDTRYTQPCMVAFACGVTEILRSKGIAPDYVCGLSLGEYSALYASGAWSLDDTMRIILTRGKAMADASEGIDTAMVAITSLSRETIAECCEKSQKEGIVSICNLNCPGQIVIGGDRNAVEYAVQLAKDAGARRCIPLPVSGPFHTKYMKPAGDKLKTVLDEIVTNKPKCEVLYNFLGGPKSDEISVKELLVNQIQHTVRMRDCIEYLIKNDVKNFIEIGPGTVLSGFVKKTFKALAKDVEEYNIIAINDKNNIQNIIEL